MTKPQDLGNIIQIANLFISILILNMIFEENINKEIINYRKINWFIPWRMNIRNPEELKSQSNQKKEKIYKDKNSDEEKSENSMISIKNKNSAYKFSFYTERKNSAKINTTSIISYINPDQPKYNKINGVPNFKKMLKRDNSAFIKETDFPSICHYKPKYDYIEKTPLKYKITTVNPIKRNIRKILCSYDITKEFVSVDMS